MTTFKLSFNADKLPVINGKVMPQTDTSGGSPWHSLAGVPFSIITRNTSEGNEILIQPNVTDSAAQHHFQIDSAGLKHMQKTNALITSNGKNISFSLSPEATAGIRHEDVSVSKSGKSIVVGGAYFPKVTFERKGHEFTVSPGSYAGELGTAHLQAEFSRNIEEPSKNSGGRPQDLPPKIKSETPGLKL